MRQYLALWASTCSCRSTGYQKSLHFNCICLPNGDWGFLDMSIPLCSVIAIWDAENQGADRGKARRHCITTAWRRYRCNLVQVITHVWLWLCPWKSSHKNWFHQCMKRERWLAWWKFEREWRFMVCGIGHESQWERRQAHRVGIGADISFHF